MIRNILKLAKNGFLKASFIGLVALFSSVLYAHVNKAQDMIPSVGIVIQGQEELIPCVEAKPSLYQVDSTPNAFNYSEILCCKKEVSVLSACREASDCMGEISAIGSSLFSGVERFLTSCFFVPYRDTFDDIVSLKVAYDSVVSINNREQEGNKLQNLVNFCLNGSHIINGLFSLTGLFCKYVLNDPMLGCDFNFLPGWLGVAQQCLLRVDTICVMIPNLAILPSICGQMFHAIYNIIY